MKIRDPVVVSDQVLPDRHRMIVFTVKSPIHEFYLWHVMIQEKL